MSEDEPRVPDHADDVGGVAPEATQALAFAIFALHDLLVAKRVIAPGEAADLLRRYQGEDNPKLMSFIEGVAVQFERMPFGPNGTLRHNIDS